MNITQSLQKWGNGTGVRIPKKVVDAAHLRINQQLTLTLQNRSIVLTPVIEKKEQTLDSMLDGVTPPIVGGELDWGKDTGAERYE